VKYSFDPPTVTPPSGSSAYATLTVSVAADASPNVYALIIKASASGGLAASDRVHYSFVVVDVPKATGFQIKVPSTTQTIAIGQSVSLKVEVASIGGFSSGVDLDLVRAPSGLVPSFDPPTVTPKPDSPATSTLRLTATTDATAGDYEVDVRGRSQGMTVTSTIRVTIQSVTTQLSLRLALTNIRIGDAIPVSGEISPSVSGASISLIYTRPDGTEFPRTITASSAGAYSDQYIPDKVGVWKVSAEYNGDSAHKGSKSSLLEFQVTEKTFLELIQQNALWVVIGIIAVAALGGGIYMTMRRRGGERRGPPPAAAPTLWQVPAPPAAGVPEAPTPLAPPRAKVERKEAPPLILPRKKCFNCNEVISGQAKFCDKCRAPQPEKIEKKYEAPPLIIPRVHCVNCGEVISAQAAFCDKCRAPQT
jgi:predicted nucleic acid-binding Zn ribbon protein